MDYTRYFNNKNVFITGHTGFKGSWLSKWLSLLGANIYGVSLDVPTNPSHYELLNINFKSDERYDISSFDSVYQSLKSVKPDYLFHLAAQPLVLKSYSDPYKTYMSNAVGTLNILESLKILNHKCNAVIITSDKGRYNKKTYDTYFEINVRATDGETVVLSDNLDLISSQDSTAIYNNVIITNEAEGSLVADKIDYNFETRYYRISMYNDESVKLKLMYE